MEEDKTESKLQMNRANKLIETKKRWRTRNYIANESANKQMN